jgi:hypothetical protein
VSRGWLVVLAAVLFLAAIFVGQNLLSRRSANQFSALARANGCSDVRDTGTSGSAQHLRPGETTRYDSSPPSHGKHAPVTLPAGVYDKPLSTRPNDQTTIYRAVHSLEHGAVIVWYDRLSTDQRRGLERRYRSAQKVIVVPYPQLKGSTHVALTAWGRLVDCQRPSYKVIDAFIDRYREARTAPEPKNRI